MSRITSSQMSSNTDEWPTPRYVFGTPTTPRMSQVAFVEA